MNKTDFLKNVFDDSRNIIRAYDIKASFVLAATLLLSSKMIDVYLANAKMFSCAGLFIGVITMLLLTACIFLCLSVLWPRSSLHIQDEDLNLNELFYPVKYKLRQYTENLKAMTDEDEINLYSQQIYKLKLIRELKHQQFMLALLALGFAIIGIITFVII